MSILQTFNNISYTKDNTSDGRIKLTIEIDNSRFELVKNKVYERLAPTVQVQGFRPGKAPKNVIIAQLGPKLFEDTVNDIVPECTLEVIKRENLIPLDRIAYEIEKVAEGSGIKYSATFSVFPEFELPDVSKMNLKRGKVEVTDKEIESVLEQMYKDREKKEAKELKKDTKGKMNDEWAVSLNVGVKNLEELKDRIKRELVRQKEIGEDSKLINQVLKEISSKCSFSVPQILIEQEVTQRENEYKSRIEKLGMKIEDFLKGQKTSMEELKKGWRNDAQERVKNEIILMKVASKYQVKVEEKEIEDQVNQIKDEKLKAQYSSEESKRYLRTVLLRQKVMQKLLNLAGIKSK